MRIIIWLVIKSVSLVFRNNPLGEILFMVAFVQFITQLDNIKTRNMTVKQRVK
jgi:hypothetical protein